MACIQVKFQVSRRITLAWVQWSCYYPTVRVYVYYNNTPPPPPLSIYLSLYLSIYPFAVFYYLVLVLSDNGGIYLRLPSYPIRVCGVPVHGHGCLHGKVSRLGLAVYRPRHHFLPRGSPVQHVSLQRSRQSMVNEGRWVLLRTAWVICKAVVWDFDENRFACS